MIEYTANTMHYFNTINNHKPYTAQEMTNSMTGGIIKYQCDNVYHNQVNAFVAQLMNIIDNAEEVK